MHAILNILNRFKNAPFLILASLFFLPLMVSAKTMEGRVISINPASNMVIMERGWGGTGSETQNIRFQIMPDTQFSGISSIRELGEGEQVRIEAVQNRGQWEANYVERIDSQIPKTAPASQGSLAASETETPGGFGVLSSGDESAFDLGTDRSVATDELETAALLSDAVRTGDLRGDTTEELEPASGIGDKAPLGAVSDLRPRSNIGESLAYGDSDESNFSQVGPRLRNTEDRTTPDEGIGRQSTMGGNLRGSLNEEGIGRESTLGGNLRGGLNEEGLGRQSTLGGNLRGTDETVEGPSSTLGGGITRGVTPNMGRSGTTSSSGLSNMSISGSTGSAAGDGGSAS